MLSSVTKSYSKDKMRALEVIIHIIVVLNEC